MFNVISVGFNIPTDEVRNMEFNASDSFLDADILLINSQNHNWYSNKIQKYNDGSFRLTVQNGAKIVREIFYKRKNEVTTLLEMGKIVVAFLTPNAPFQLETKNLNYETYSNYSWLPEELKDFRYYIQQGNGFSITLDKFNSPLSAYYRAFKDELQYTSYLSSDFNRVAHRFIEGEFLLTNRTNNVVGFSKRIKNGLLVFVPFPPQNCTAQKLLGVLINCCKPILTNNIKSEEPQWSRQFVIPGEEAINLDIEKVSAEMDTLKTKLLQLEKSRNNLQEYRSLLFEQGKPLEEAVIKAFKLMDFEVEKHEDKDMEHDIILQSVEGRIIGEIEGKDNDAINISKLDQLSRVVDEDFYKNGTYPEGILIGNPYRLFEPEGRRESFTEKVLIAAKRKGFGLINTIELFNASINLLNNPHNEDLKKGYRETIFSSLGSEIKF